MARLTLSLPTELGPAGANGGERVGCRREQYRRYGDVPQIVRWLACWAGKASG